MKSNDLKAKTPKELQERVAALQKEIQQYSFQRVTGQLKAMRAIRVAKKEIAQILTILASK